MSQSPPISRPGVLLPQWQARSVRAAAGWLGRRVTVRAQHALGFLDRIFRPYRRPFGGGACRKREIDCGGEQPEFCRPDGRTFAGPSGDGQAKQLLQTIRAFADASFNVKETARHLGVHTNTVYFRLNRIQQLTGIDARTYSGTSRL